MEEEWKEIIGYEGLYEVSSFGRVKSTHFKKEAIISLNRSHKGYMVCILYKDKKRSTKQVHRLVAEAFLPNPHNLPQVNHKDEDKTNNHKENLEWCDAKYNVNYGTGKDRSAEHRMNHPAKSHPILQYTLSGILIKEYSSETEAERQTGVYQGNISKCCRGERYTAGGFCWEYKKRVTE